MQKILHSYVYAKMALPYTRYGTTWGTLNARSSGMIRIRIDGPRPFGSWCMKETEWPKVDGFTVCLIHHAPSDPGFGSCQGNAAKME